MALELKFLEIFYKYDIFAYGLEGALFSILLWFLIGYSILRVYEKKPAEKTIEVISPIVMVALFMNFINLGSLFTGLGVIITLFTCVKIFTNMEWHQFGIFVFQILTLSFIFGNAYEFGLPLFFIYILYNFLKGERTINKNKKQANESS